MSEPQQEVHYKVAPVRLVLAALLFPFAMGGLWFGNHLHSRLPARSPCWSAGSRQGRREHGGVADRPFVLGLPTG